MQALATIIQIACYLFINYWLVSYLSNGSSDNFYWSYIIQASTPLAVETITTLVLVIVVWIDYRQGAQYHWTHWLGVTIWLSMWLSMLVALVWTLMAPPDWLTGQDGWSTFLAE